METLLLIVVLGLVICFLWGRKGSSESPQMAPHNASLQESRRDELYRQLLNQLLGDREKAQRLIEFERRKDPRLTEEQCIEMASRMIEKDHKRWD